MDMDFEKIKKGFKNKADDYINDKDKAKKLVDEAKKKAKRKGPLEELWEDIQLLFGIISDWATGKYTDVPKGSIIAIIIGLLYFVSPIDLIPDFLPGGLLDDAAVLALVIAQVKSDLDKYKQWREETQK